MNPPASSSTNRLDDQPWKITTTYARKTSRRRRQFLTNSTRNSKGLQTKLVPPDLELYGPQKRRDQKLPQQYGYIPCPYQLQSHPPLPVESIFTIRESISQIIVFFPLFYFWFWRIKPFFLTSPFFEYMSTRYYFLLSYLFI